MDNWNRWGADDERGAANLAGVDAVRRGLAAVRDGRPISLAAPIVANRGFGIVGRPAPQHFMLRDGGDYAAGGLTERAGFGFADDWVAMPTHGVSHLDALSHVWQSGLMYNGHPVDAVTSRGARRCGIEKAGPIVTRGVFVDLLAPDQERLAAGEAVGAGRLQRGLDAIGVDLQPGDALLLRTGWLAAWSAGAMDGTAWPGLDTDCAQLLADADITLVGADNPGIEVLPSTVPDCQVPLHVALLRGRGVYFSELLALDELAASGRTTFLFVIAPLPLVGAVGSPVSPVAVV